MLLFSWRDGGVCFLLFIIYYYFIFHCFFSITNIIINILFLCLQVPPDPLQDAIAKVKDVFSFCSSCQGVSTMDGGQALCGATFLYLFFFSPLFFFHFPFVYVFAHRDPNRLGAPRGALAHQGRTQDLLCQRVRSVIVLFFPSSSFSVFRFN